MTVIVNNTIARTAIAPSASAIITGIIARNTTVNGEAVLDGPVTRADMAGAITVGFPANGAHGNKEVFISAFNWTTPTQIASIGTSGLRPRSKAGYFWLAYAQHLPPAHAQGQICTMAEFFCPSTNATTRLLYEYLRGLFLYTTNHYNTYDIISAAGAPIRDF
jgi:hypothetical protein